MTFTEYYLQCAEIIKNTMDEKFPGAGFWNVVVGESFDVSFNGLSLFNHCPHLLYHSSPHIYRQIIFSFRLIVLTTREARCSCTLRELSLLSSGSVPCDTDN